MNKQIHADENVSECINCRYRDEIEQHHVVPLSKGGLDTSRNTVPVCRGCHLAIHTGRSAPTAESKNRSLGEFGVEPGGTPVVIKDNFSGTGQKRLDDFSTGN